MNWIKKNDEYIFQGIVALLLIIISGIDNDNHEKEFYFYWDTFLFFGNYLLASSIINYYLLPKLAYKGKTLLFALSTITVLLLAMVMEELVLEQIFYPKTRGEYFGFFQTLFEIVPVVLIFVGYKIVWDLFAKEKKLKEMEKMISESELLYLKAQINPHFLFNNLNNLYSYALENSPKTPEIILSLSSVLRYMLYECNDKYVSLSKEIQHIRNYIDLNELQFESRGQINLKVIGEMTDHKIAPLILIVFIENAVKHSSASVKDNISINVIIEVTDNGLMFSCSNPFQPDNNIETHSGIGLENVRSRLEKLYPEKHELRIEASGEVFSVHLKINLLDE